MSRSEGFRDEAVSKLGDRPLAVVRADNYFAEGAEADDEDDLMSPLLLRIAIQRYLTARRNDLTPASLRGIRDNLLHFARHVGDRPFKSVKRHHVEDWVASMNVTANTIRNRLNALRGLYRWALAHEHVKTDPTLGVSGPRAPQLMPRELAHERIEAVLASVPDCRGELMVLLGVEEGLRISEIASLKRENIDLDGQMMLVMGKGRKERWLPITDSTADAMRDYLGEVPGNSGPLLRSYSHPNRGISAGFISTLISRWMYEAGVKRHAWDGTSAHALRHSMAGCMLDAGADIRDVQSALGHADLGATYVYLRRRSAATKLRESMGTRSYGEDAA